jgi:hypothetical protein
VDLAHRGRLLFKRLNGVLHVLFETDEKGTPRAPLGAGARLRVGLKLVDTTFHNVTDLPAFLGNDLACYENRTSATALEGPRAATLLGSSFTHHLSSASRPVSVVLENAAGTPVFSTTLEAADTQASVSFDARRLDLGILAVMEDYGNANTNRTPYYLHPELSARGIFAVVDIDVAAGFYDTAPAFEVAFQARSEHLSYYVVAHKHSDADFAALRVRDGDTTRALQFTRASAADTVLAAELLAPGDSRLALFRSNDSVPRQRMARRKIQLLRNNEVLIDSLPQPGSSQADANLIIHISK